MSVYVIVGLVCVLLGAAFGAIVMGLLTAPEYPEIDNPYGFWLDRHCWVKDAETEDEWEECRIVAVSHRGGVAVRRTDGLDDRAHWIPKYLVSRTVSFSNPTDEMEW